MVATTPGSLSNGGSMHQKQPPAKVATLCPGGTVTGVAASVDMLARRIEKKAAVRIYHSMKLGSHNHAAPRTPLESPCAGGTIRVRKSSENTNSLHRRPTLA